MASVDLMNTLCVLDRFYVKKTNLYGNYLKQDDFEFQFPCNLLMKPKVVTKVATKDLFYKCALTHHRTTNKIIIV